MTVSDRSPDSSDGSSGPPAAADGVSDGPGNGSSGSPGDSAPGTESAGTASGGGVPSTSGERSTRAAPAGSVGDAGTETSVHAGLGSISADALGAANQNELGALPVRSRARYELLGEHARGGLGKILKARDKDLGRDLAIKEMRAPNSAAAARFVREALITARLEHPSIVPVHEAGRWENGEPFYAMKLVSGRTLKEAVQQARGLTARLALLPSVIAVVDAIAYAHDQGVIHRDLKAANVIVGAFGETVVIDWGLAKDLHRPDDLLAEGQSPYRVNAEYTIAGAVVGTPAFMPPEQARGEEVDARADVYALGALLYYTLSGMAPHDGASSADILARARTAQPRPLAEVAPGVPPDLAAIVAKAMARQRDDRYQTAQALAGDLKRFQTGQLVSAHQYSLAQRALRWVRKHRGVTALSALFVVVGAMGATLYVLNEQRLRREAEEQRDRADQQTLALLEQQGRSELDAGRPFRAAVYLTEALQRNPESLALRGLVTQAVRPMATLQRELVGHTHDVTSVSYSRDGSRILTTSWDKTARIWSSETGQLLHTLPIGTDLEHAAFSPDGKLVATEAGDKKLRVWNAETGALLETIEGKRLYRTWFTSDGRRIIVGDSFGAMRVYDLDQQRWVFDETIHQDRVQCAALTADGKTLFTGSLDRTVTAWDLATMSRRFVIRDHDSAVQSVALSHDERVLLTSENESVIQVRDAATGSRLYSIRLPEEAKASHVHFAPDDRTIISTSFDGVMRIWHTTSGALLASIDAVPSGQIFGSALRPDGKQMVTAGLAGSVRVWSWGDSLGYRLLQEDDHRAPVMPSGFSGDGTRIVTGTGDGVVSVWDTQSARRLGRFQVHGNVHSLASNRDASRVLSSGDHPDALPPALWETSTGARVAHVVGHIPGKMIHNVEVSADGATMATASYDGSLRFFDAEDLRPLGAVELDPKVKLTAVAFRPDGREVAASNADGKVMLIDRASGKVTRTIEAHPTWIQDLVYSRDGARLLSVGRQDQTAKVWSAASGALELTLAGHESHLFRGDFSPDGRYVATASTDRSAIVWDAATGEVVRTVSGPRYTAVFSPDGRELLTTGSGGYAVLWDTSLDLRTPAELAAFVAERSPWKLTEGRLVLHKTPGPPRP
jgi:WD40 repeat protein